MSMNERVPDEESPADFSFGVRELTQAAELRIADAPLALVTETEGFDPYNSTGRFDRADAWSRIRRR